MSTQTVAGTVLVVDDDTAQVELIQSLLEDHGYRVHAAANGKEALEQVVRVLPDLVLLDLMMPVMSGYEFLRHLWAQEKVQNVPVVVISGAHVPYPGGTVGFLRKPLDAAQLLAEVDRGCRKSKAAGALSSAET